MTENLNISGEQERKELDCAEAERAERKKSEYLAEAWRLLELQIGEKIERNDRIERKAFLLVTFSVAIIGYLFSTINFNETCSLFLWIMSVLKIVVCGALGWAVWHGVAIFNLEDFVEKGLNPKYVMNKYYNFDLDKFREYLLLMADIDELLENSDTILNGKAESLKTGIKLLKWSMIFAFILTLVEKLLPLAENFFVKIDSTIGEKCYVFTFFT